MSLDLNQARTIIAAALAHGQAAGMNPLCVAVLDAGGHLIAFEREDGVPNMRFEVAHGKAHGAIQIGFGSRPRCLMTGLPSYSVKVRPLSLE